MLWVGCSGLKGPGISDLWFRFGGFGYVVWGLKVRVRGSRVEALQALEKNEI